MYYSKIIKKLNIVLLLLFLTGCSSENNSHNLEPGLTTQPPALDSIADIFVLEGETITFTPTANDPDGDELTFSYSGWMTSNNYTTLTSDVGSHLVTVTVSDGELTDTQNVTVTVNRIISGENSYFVSPEGTSSWSECANITTPCSGKTAVENADAGDVVYFRGGTYDPAADPVQEWIDRSDELKWETLPWNPQNSGTPGNPITFIAYPGETPIIIDNIWSGAFGVANRDWIIWDGFSAQIEDRYGEYVNTLAVFLKSNNCVLRNSNLTGILKAHHNNNALIFIEDSSFILIENNEIHDNNGYDGGDEDLGILAEPEFVQESNNTTGLMLYSVSDSTIRNNNIYNNYMGIFDKDNGENNKFYKNHIWGGSEADHNACTWGIRFGNNQGGGGSNNEQFFQNIIRNCELGFFSEVGDSSESLVLTINTPKIYNNVIYGGDVYDRGFFGTTDKAITSAEFYNNIIVNYNYGISIFSSPASYEFVDRNIYFNVNLWNYDGYEGVDYGSLNSWNGATGFDSISITTDPLFVNPTGSNPEDYKVREGSPALGLGIDRQDYNNDDDMSESINIGAYITGDEVIGFTED